MGVKKKKKCCCRECFQCNWGGVSPFNVPDSMIVNIETPHIYPCAQTDFLNRSYVAKLGDQCSYLISESIPDPCGTGSPLTITGHVQQGYGYWGAGIGGLNVQINALYQADVLGLSASFTHTPETTDFADPFGWYEQIVPFRQYTVGGFLNAYLIDSVVTVTSGSTPTVGCPECVACMGQKEQVQLTVPGGTMIGETQCANCDGAEGVFLLDAVLPQTLNYCVYQSEPIDICDAFDYYRWVVVMSSSFVRAYLFAYIDDPGFYVASPVRQQLFHATSGLCASPNHLILSYSAPGAGFGSPLYCNSSFGKTVLLEYDS